MKLTIAPGVRVYVDVESVLRRCIAKGPVRGEGFAIDADVIKADGNRARGIADPTGPM